MNLIIICRLQMALCYADQVYIEYENNNAKNCHVIYRMYNSICDYWKVDFPDYISEKGMNILAFCATIEQVNYFVDLGCDISCKTVNGHDVIQHWVDRGQVTLVAHALRKKWCSPHDRVMSCYTRPSLRWFCTLSWKQYSITQLMIDAGANPDMDRDDVGSSVVHFIEELCPFTEHLLDRHVSLHTILHRNKFKNTAFDICLDHNLHDVLQWLVDNTCILSHIFEGLETVSNYKTRAIRYTIRTRNERALQIMCNDTDYHDSVVSWLYILAECDADKDFIHTIRGNVCFDAVSYNAVRVNNFETVKWLHDHKLLSNKLLKSIVIQDYRIIQLVKSVYVPVVYSDDVCCICLDDMNTRNNQTLPCGHVMHSDCVAKLHITLCPLCRKPFSDPGRDLARNLDR
jgi:hypothetical protein